MSKRWLTVAYCLAHGGVACAGITTYADRRQRVIVVNKSSETIYIAIHKDPSVPLDREAVAPGDRTYFFPRVLDEQSFYYIVVKSSSHEAYYTLHLSGNLTVSDAHACRAYGELSLMMEDWVVQTISAASVRQGIVLTYNRDFELRFGLVYIASRPHKPECRQQRHATGCCICRRPCGVVKKGASRAR